MKKKLNIFLLVFVLGLWGTVFYKYVSQYLQPNDVLQTATPQKILSAATKAKDTFEMKSIARDPFLNSATVKRPVANTVRYSRPAAVKKAPVVKYAVAFPEVNYFGYIKAHQKEVALLKVNNKLVKLNAGELSDGLKVVKVFKDSVQVSFEGEIRFVKRAAAQK